MKRRTVSDKWEFKANVRGALLYLLWTNALVSVVFLLARAKSRIDTAFILFAVVNVSYLLSVISKPCKIIIDEAELSLEIHYPLKLLRKPVKKPLHDVECSFNYEVRARGLKGKVLRIKQDKNSIAELLPGFGGWRSKSLEELCEKLNQMKHFDQSPNQ